MMSTLLQITWNMQLWCTSSTAAGECRHRRSSESADPAAGLPQASEANAGQQAVTGHNLSMYSGPLMAPAAESVQ